MDIKGSSNFNVDDLTKKVVEVAKREIEARVAASICPVHGAHPSNIRITGETVEQIRWTADCCCDRLRAEVHREFGVG